MLSSGKRVPSSRFRMLPYVQHFQASGHRCHVAHSFPEKYEFFPRLGFRPSQKLKRFVRYVQWIWSRCRRDNVTIIDREVFDDPTTICEERFRKTCSKLVLDLDDAVFLRYPEKFERLARMADLIVCGNTFIQEWAAARNPHTVIIPTCVDSARFTEKDHSPLNAKPVRIGWTGVPGNIRYLQVVAPALRRLATDLPFELVVISSDEGPLKDVDLAGVAVRFVAWDGPREAEQLHELDIGLMPLFGDSEWDKYKCGFKLIQYMATGIASVASPVGVNTSIVAHEINGFVANTEADWELLLRQLVINEPLRRSIGSAGRKTVLERFSIDANYPIYEAALKQLFAEKG